VNPINLEAECGPLPSGGDLAGYGGYTGNLVLTVEGVLNWTGPMAWGVRIEKPTITATGRKGKPRKVFLLVANEGQTVPDLLRQIAHMWELGTVEPGVEYPAPTDAEASA
jgi:hypothetical protein